MATYLKYNNGLMIPLKMKPELKQQTKSGQLYDQFRSRFNKTNSLAAVSLTGFTKILDIQNSML